MSEITVKHRNYYDGDLSAFKAWLANIPSGTQGDKIRNELKNTLTLIGVPDENGLVSDGYVYARGVFYKMSSTGSSSFDPKDYPLLEKKYNLWFAEDYGKTILGKDDTSLITKGYLELHTAFEDID